MGGGSGAGSGSGAFRHLANMGPVVPRLAQVVLSVTLVSAVTLRAITLRAGLQNPGVRLLPGDGVHVGKRGAGGPASACAEASVLAQAAGASAAGEAGAEQSRTWSLRIDAAVGTYVVCWVDSLSGAQRPVGELHVGGPRLR